jgi:hypothetical protein
MKEEIGGRNKLLRDQLHTLCPSINIRSSTRSNRARLVRHEERRDGKCTQNFSRRSLTGKDKLIKPRLKWNGNIKTYLKEIAYEVVGWIHPA